MRIPPPAPSLLACLALWGAAAPVAAWQAPPASVAATRPAKAPPAMDRARQARLAAQDAEIGAAARQVLALVDAGRIDDVWEGASPAMKRAVPKGEFARQVAQDRARLGKVLSRAAPRIGRERHAAGGRVPQGEYLNVAFPTRFAATRAAIRELVSFRLDEDRVWRVSGYSVR